MSLRTLLVPAIVVALPATVVAQTATYPAAGPAQRPGFASGIVAAGTTQATATPLVADVSVVGSVSTGSGVILPGYVGPGVQRSSVYNRGANAFPVYPPSGAAIEGQAINSGYSVAVGGQAVFDCISPTQCYVNSTLSTLAGLDLSASTSIAQGGNTARTQAADAADLSNILSFGAKCDGTSHPLSASFSTLAAAQAAYPQALALSDEIDTDAIRLALAKTGAAYLPKLAGCLVGDLAVTSADQRVWGNRSVVVPAAGASRMILLSGYANVVEGLDIHDNGSLVAQSTLAAPASAGDTSITVGPLTSGPPVQVGQRISLRLNAGTHVSTWVSSVAASGSNFVIGLRDPIPSLVPVAGVLTAYSAGTALAAVGNGFAATFGAIHVTNAKLAVVRNIVGANLWGGINLDTAAAGAGNPGAAKGIVEDINFQSIRMFGVIKGRNASDNHFDDLELWGGFYSSTTATGDGSTTTFPLPEQVNLSRELTVTVAGSTVTNYTIAANGLSVTFAAAPASGAAISFGFQAYGDDGLVDDGRDTVTATGGNFFNNVSALAFRRCGLLKGAQLYAITGQSIFDTCSEEALVLDGVTQVGALNAFVGWSSIISLYVTNGSAGAKSSDITLSPQTSGYSVSGAVISPVKIDTGSDLTGRVYNKGAGFVDYNGGLAKYTVDNSGNAYFVGTGGSLFLNPTGNTFAFTSQYAYIADATSGSNLVLQSVGTNGLLQEQATATIKQTIGSTDMLTTDANGMTIPKLSAAPTTAPGTGRVRLFAIAGTTSGTCKLMVQAGTSATASTVTDNIGSGC